MKPGAARVTESLAERSIPQERTAFPRGSGSAMVTASRDADRLADHAICTPIRPA